MPFSYNYFSPNIFSRFSLFLFFFFCSVSTFTSILSIFHTSCFSCCCSSFFSSPSYRSSHPYISFLPSLSFLSRFLLSCRLLYFKVFLLLFLLFYPLLFLLRASLEPRKSLRTSPPIFEYLPSLALSVRSSERPNGYF